MADELTHIPLTPQEILLAGGTMNVGVETSGDNWYKPTGVRLGMSALKIRETRERMKVFRSPSVLAFLSLSGIPAFTLEEIDDNGMTILDPSIVQIDQETGVATVMPGLMERVREKFLEYGIDLHLRPKPETPEGQATQLER